jgi:hypothetical protein
MTVAHLATVTRERGGEPPRHAGTALTHPYRCPRCGAVRALVGLKADPVCGRGHRLTTMTRLP